MTELRKQLLLAKRLEVFSELDSESRTDKLELLDTELEELECAYWCSSDADAFDLGLAEAVDDLPRLIELLEV